MNPWTPLPEKNSLEWLREGLSPSRATAGSGATSGQYQSAGSHGVTPASLHLPDVKLSLFGDNPFAMQPSGSGWMGFGLGSPMPSFASAFKDSPIADSPPVVPTQVPSPSLPPLLKPSDFEFSLPAAEPFASPIMADSPVVTPFSPDESVPAVEEAEDTAGTIDVKVRMNSTA